MSINSDWQQFLLGESMEEKNIFTYLQGLHEVINSLRPKTVTEQRRIALAKQHLKEVKRLSRRMLNEMKVLEEKLLILEEGLHESAENDG